MISKELTKIMKQMISQEDKMHFVEAATQEQITAFEKEKGIHLPEKLKEWLQLSDGGEFYLPAGIQLHGVAHKPFIDVSDNNRPDDRFIVIGELSSGDPLLCEKDSERISIYNQEAGRIEDDETYPDFFAFLNDLPNIVDIGG